MNILYTSTRSWYRYLKWSIASLREHHPEAEIYVLAEDDDVGIEGVTALNMTGQTFFREDGPNFRTYFSHMTLMRVLAPLLLPLDKVLYLDADTIVTDDLTEMYNTDLTGKWLGWVEEKNGFFKPYGPRYWNSGVMLMNLRQMRDDHVAETLIEMLNTERFAFNEQCALNRFVPPCRMVELETRFNEAACTEMSRRPAIVHFAGVPNWYANTTMKRHEFLDKYRRANT